MGGVLNHNDLQCYRYWVLDRLCLKIDFVKSSASNKDSIVVQGGCFEDDEPGYYVQAYP